LTKPRIAVVIPTLNEEQALARSLPIVVSTGVRVVIADGGSRDSTRDLARRLGAVVVEAPRGRGPQLNAGAAACDAEAILFLHADTVPPSTAIVAVEEALQHGFVGGGFLVRFDAPGAVYRFGSAMVNLRSRLTRLPLGDQAQFASRRVFESLGGFREWPILEDLDFIRRLRTAGRVAVLSPPVHTSARRFEQFGPVRTLANNWLIFTLFALGASPAQLRRLYPEPIETVGDAVTEPRPDDAQRGR
jgi:rSAM/selenodomain-associated transferase 2